MTTRADFYIGKGDSAQWLGSIGSSGSPDKIPKKILKATSEKDFLKQLNAYSKIKHPFTNPVQGWPWPWKNSHLTDYSYSFIDGRVYVSCFGSKWTPYQEYTKKQGWLILAKVFNFLGITVLYYKFIDKASELNKELVGGNYAEVPQMKIIKEDVNKEDKGRMLQ